MELTTTDSATRISGLQTVVATSGQNVKIETSPAGTEVLNVNVPVGKEWSVMFLVVITEEDV